MYKINAHVVSVNLIFHAKYHLQRNRTSAVSHISLMEVCMTFGS